jgi:hypothetical protein
VLLSKPSRGWLGRETKRHDGQLGVAVHVVDDKLQALPFLRSSTRFARHSKGASRIAGPLLLCHLSRQQRAQQPRSLLRRPKDELHQSIGGRHKLTVALDFRPSSPTSGAARTATRTSPLRAQVAPLGATEHALGGSRPPAAQRARMGGWGHEIMPIAAWNRVLAGRYRRSSPRARSAHAHAGRSGGRGNAPRACAAGGAGGSQGCP